MSIFTEAEIRQKITNISKAIDIVLSGGKSYSLSDGLGSHQVTRSSLSELQNALNYWTDELEELTGFSGIISLRKRTSTQEKNRYFQTGSGNILVREFATTVDEMSSNTAGSTIWL